MTKLSDIVKKKKDIKRNFFIGKIASLCEEYWNKALGKEYNVIIKNSEDIKQEIDFSSLKIPDTVKIENAKEIADHIVIPKQEDFPSEIKVSNISDLSKYFKEKKIVIPKSFDIKNLKDIPKVDFPENLKKLSFKKTEETLAKIEKGIVSSNRAKTSDVFVKNKEPKDAIPVKMVDKKGRDFIESFGSSVVAFPQEIGITDKSKGRINPATSENQNSIEAKIDTLSSNVATDTKLDEVITAVKGVSGRYLPTYDTKEIDETDANNVVITYKLNSATVATETIAVSGKTTTISLVLA